MVFSAYVRAAVVDACGDTGSHDERLEYRASRRVATSWCIEELRSRVEVALTDASRVGTNVACASLAEVEDGADIDSINDDPDVRRAGGATSREQAKT
uniref:Uncharacterized protein n=1 Tax=Physcomitrium patens TaxID=3218 RepID=A0A2K1IWL7_PHYPA|nr:hypothetical protein PHYPA_023489 [Physcomitrium patens]